ncbi:uncharacterized protein LOC114468322 isoform X2 [Gouania willdenowi]|uniref:uncharacterized protein LOC114468322 isoform X2 n=1 Tax=Gouania willdenowi TaxID=441366 RepID=UPI001054F869|nr:uncharacterized protein LOC114468322 isoform X2 [Gouania willdenowi]
MGDQHLSYQTFSKEKERLMGYSCRQPSLTMNTGHLSKYMLIFVALTTSVLCFLLWWMDTLERIPDPAFVPQVLTSRHNLCAFRPLSPEEAVEEEFILHSIAWPETPSVTLNFSLKNTTDPSCSKFTILPKVGGGQWSIGDQLEVRIIMKDYYCHPKTSGGDALLARLRNEALDAGVSGQVVDHLNGSYTAVFPLVWEGRADVQVTLIHPSEAITVLRRLNNESLDRVFFRSVFRSGSVTETSMCNVCLRPTNMPVCNYTDIRTGEPWFCLKPKSLSCNARIIHSMGGYLPALKPLEDKLFRMMWLPILLVLGLNTPLSTSDLIEPGPRAGIVLKEQPGLLITNCRIHSQKVFVRFNPKEVFRKLWSQKPETAKLVDWAATKWPNAVLEHTEADLTHMLSQLEKFTITQAEFSNIHTREKRFVGALLMAASALGSIFSVGMSTVNAVSIATIKRQVKEVKAEIPALQRQVDQQQKTLEVIGKTLKNTITVLNTQSVALNKTINTINHLVSIMQVDYFLNQIITQLTEDLLREVTNSVENLALGRIPPYLVPLSLVQNILTTATRDRVTPIQAHLAYTLGSAIPLHVNPESREIAFLISLPVVASDNVYRLKDVVNVGTWNEDTHVQVETPSIIAYHDDNQDLYLAPNLRMCTRTKDIHYLCPSKPFIRDNTNGICGLQPMNPDNQCSAAITTRTQVTTTQAEIVGHRWLVHSPAKFATLSYDQHDTNTRVSLINQVMWITVPENAILHIDDLALFHLPPEQYQTDIEMPDFFKDLSLEISPQTLTQIQYEGTKIIDITPLDNVLKELKSTTKTPNQPLMYTWSTPDTSLAMVIILSYIVFFGVATLSFRRTKNLQDQINRCSDRLFKRKQNRFKSPAEDTPEGQDLTVLVDP